MDYKPGVKRGVGWRLGVGMGGFLDAEALGRGEKPPRLLRIGCGLCPIFPLGWGGKFEPGSVGPRAGASMFTLRTSNSDGLAQLISASLGQSFRSSLRTPVRTRMLSAANAN